MANGGHVAALKAREVDATAVEGDDRRAVDRKSHPTAVELAERKERRSHADDDAAVDGNVPCRAGRSKHERDAEYEPDPSHPRMLANARQGGVCGV
jgi:hypothetical protein